MGLKKGSVVITQNARLSIREIYDYVKSWSSKEPSLAEYAEGFQSVSVWEYVIIFLVKKDANRSLYLSSARNYAVNRVYRYAS